MHDYNFQHDRGNRRGLIDTYFSFAIKPFLLQSNFNTKILNQLIFTFIDIRIILHV